MTTPAKTSKVINALAIDVTTRIQRGKRALDTRNPFAASDPIPVVVASEKKFQRNRPMMSFSL